MLELGGLRTKVVYGTVFLGSDQIISITEDVVGTVTPIPSILSRCQYKIIFTSTFCVYIVYIIVQFLTDGVVGNLMYMVFDIIISWIGRSFVRK